MREILAEKRSCNQKLKARNKERLINDLTQGQYNQVTHTNHGNTNTSVINKQQVVFTHTRIKGWVHSIQRGRARPEAAMGAVAMATGWVTPSIVCTISHGYNHGITQAQVQAYQQEMPGPQGQNYLEFSKYKRSMVQVEIITKSGTHETSGIRLGAC